MYAFPQFFLSDTWTLITQNVWFPISLHVPAFLCLSVCVCVCAQSLSHVQVFGTPWTIAHQAPLFMEFYRYDY